MTPERLAEIRDRVTYNPEDWPITIELVAHIDTITAENDRLKGEVERLKRLNTSLVYGHDIFKLAALRVESTLRTQRDALVTAGEEYTLAVDKFMEASDTFKQEESDTNATKVRTWFDVMSSRRDALTAAVKSAEKALLQGKPLVLPDKEREMLKYPIDKSEKRTDGTSAPGCKHARIAGEIAIELRHLGTELFPADIDAIAEKLEAEYGPLEKSAEEVLLRINCTFYTESINSEGAVDRLRAAVKSAEKVLLQGKPPVLPEKEGDMLKYPIMMDDKLKPCPLPSCGSEVDGCASEGDGVYWIECPKCGLKTRRFLTSERQELLRYWNTRSVASTAAVREAKEEG